MDTTLSRTEEAIADVLRRSGFTEGNDRLILSRHGSSELAQRIHERMFADDLYIPEIRERANEAQVIEFIAEQMRPRPDIQVTDFGSNIPVLAIAERIYISLNAHGLLSNPRQF